MIRNPTNSHRLKPGRRIPRAIARVRGTIAVAVMLFVTMPAWSVPPELHDDFEAYTPGTPLRAQSTWFNIHDTGDIVVGSGISGVSGGHESNGNDAFGQVLARQAASSAFGISSASVRLVGTGTYYSLFVSSISNFLNAGMAFSGGGGMFALQYIPGEQFLSSAYLAIDWVPDTNYRFSIDVPGDGTSRTYLDGRLVFIGADMTVALSGSPSPVNFIGVRTGNDVAGTRMLLDDVNSAFAPTVDAPGAADLYLGATFNDRVPGELVETFGEAILGSSVDITLFVHNTSSTTVVDGAQMSAAIPAELSYSDDSCGGSFAGGTFSAPALSINPGESVRCVVTLTLPESSIAADWTIEAQVTASGSVPDPYDSNNRKELLLVPASTEVFGDGFEATAALRKEPPLSRLGDVGIP